MEAVSVPSVDLPPGVNRLDWIAENFVDLYADARETYAVLRDTCTAKSCPKCFGPPGPKDKEGNRQNVEFQWGFPGGPKTVCAPEYFDRLFLAVQSLMDTDDVFRKDKSVPLTKNFEGQVREQLRRLFRVYMHAFTFHFEDYRRADKIDLLTRSFKRFVRFVKAFQLEDPASMALLQPLCDLAMK